jgi:alpha-tubulin suppressor-like RCC1 family protein
MTRALVLAALVTAACGGTIAARPTPHRSPARAPRAVGIVAGAYHTCARMDDGSVVCWGSGAAGQTGLGPAGADHPTPARVPGVERVAALRAASFLTCARTQEGAERCFGLEPLASEPARAPGEGWRHRCELTEYRVACRGDGSFGQRGDGTTNGGDEPVLVPALEDAVAIAAGRVHTCALRVGGDVLCWGDNTFGQLGDGTRERRMSPTRVALR